MPESSAKRRHGKDVYVEPRPGGWQVRKQGNQRATALVDTKKQAERIGRDAARKERSDLFIKGEDGKVRRTTPTP